MKTAGTSLELAFSKACGPEDIVARIRPKEPDLEQRTDLRFENATFTHKHSGKTRVLRQHSSLRHAAEVLGEQIADYRIVVSERNPWTKLRSSFFWKLHQSPAQVVSDKTDTEDSAQLQDAFKRFVQSPVKDACDAFDMYSHDWHPLADHVIRFESLSGDLETTARALDLPSDVRLPDRAAKGGIRRPDVDLTFDAEMDKIVRLRFSREIAWFGYDAPDSTGSDYQPPSSQAEWKSDFFQHHKSTAWQHM